MEFIKRWLFRLLLLVIFVVALLAASDNSQEARLGFLGYETPEWPLSWWMLTAFVVGVLFGVLLNAWSNTKLRLKARQAKRQTVHE